MKRLCSAALVILLFFSYAMAEEGSKYNEMPAILAAEIISDERKVD